MLRSLTRFERVAPLIVLIALLLVHLIDTGPIRRFQNLTFDAYQRMKPREQDYANSPVRVVDIDEDSLRKYGQWPWPRTLMAELTQRLAAAGAAAIAFDMVFAEPDRLSPGNVAKLWQQTPETQLLVARLVMLPDHDRLFAEALAKAPAVTGFVVVAGGGGTPLRKVGFGIVGDDPVLAINGGSGVISNVAALEQAARGNGAFNWFADGDSIIRRVPTVVRHHDELYPSLFAEALRVAQGALGYKIRGIPGGRGMELIQIGQFVIDTDNHGQVFIHFARADPREANRPTRYIPAWRVIENGLKPDEVDGRIVFVGTSAVGLYDIRSTPLDPAVPGVEVHAQAVEATVAGAYLQRPDIARGIEFAFIAAVGLLIIGLTPRVGARWAGAVGFGGIAAAVIGAWFAFDAFRWMLDALFPALAVLLVFVFSTLSVYLRSEQERRQIRGAFGRYLAPALVERLAADPQRLKLGGEMRDMTILFSDIRGFTGISERLDAEGLTNFMNRYLTPMTDAILKEGGTVDKYMGDAIMAFWNAPLDDPDHARHACRAALTMQERLAELNAELQREATEAGKPFVPVMTGTGLNSAVCCVGNMGSQQRFDYSVLGDGVNLTSRLEGQTKSYAVPIIIGDETRRKAPEFAALEIDLIRVKGKREPSRIYALLGGPMVAKELWFATLEAEQAKILSEYRARHWDNAQAAIAAARAAAGGSLDSFYEFFASRIAEFRQSPPAEDWDGVYTAEEK